MMEAKNTTPISNEHDGDDEVDGIATSSTTNDPQPLLVPPKITDGNDDDDDDDDDLELQAQQQPLEPASAAVGSETNGTMEKMEDEDPPTEDEPPQPPTATTTTTTDIENDVNEAEQQEEGMVKMEEEEAGEAEPQPQSVSQPEEDTNAQVLLLPSKEGEGEEDAQQQQQYPPTFFTDDRGNLKFVNLVVKYPCSIFWFLLVLCLLISFVLIAIVFREGNPFTEPTNEFDLKDVRSIQYDSLRLAQELVEKSRDDITSKATTTTTIKQQSEVGDVTYWTFESQTPDGVFGSEESIYAMKDAFDVFLKDQGFEDYCWIKEGHSKCNQPLTPLSMYFAKQWDTELVGTVIEHLKSPKQVDLFNNYSLCFTRDLYCDLILPPEGGAGNLSDSIPQDDIEFVWDLHSNITQITNGWRLTIPDTSDNNVLISNFSQATEFAAYMLQLDLYKGLVDFGFDKTFSIHNQKSQFSRGIVWWGSPLFTDRQLGDGEGNGEEERDEALDEEDDDKRKDYILEHYLDEMDEQAKAGTHDTINSYYFMRALLFDIILDIVQRDAMLAIISMVFVFLWLRINTNSWFLAFVGIFEIFFSIPVAWFIFNVVFRINYFATLNTLSLFIVAAIGADDIFIFMDAYKQSRYRNPHNLIDLPTRMSWVYRRTGTAMAITSATTCCAFLCTLITPLTSMRSFGIFAAVVIFIDYVLVMSLFCTAVVIYHDRFEDRACCGCCCTGSCCCCCPIPHPSPTQTAKAELEDTSSRREQHEKSDVVSYFFRTRVAGFINVPLHRLVLGVIFLSWLGVAIWKMTLLEPTKEIEQVLDENHPLQKSVLILNKEFPTADQDSGLKVYYSWGLGEVDRKGVNLLLDPEFYGTPTFVEEFDFNEQCQTELLSLCDKFKTDPKYKGLIKRKSGLGQVYCFVEELGAYRVLGNLTNCRDVQSGQWKQEEWQIPPSDLPALMEGFLQEKSCYDEDGVETISTRYTNELGWDGLSMRYAAVSVESEVLSPFGRDAESLTRGEYDQFVMIAEEVDKVVSLNCSGTVVMTDLDEKFVFMNNQSIYKKTAIQSAILGVVIAFVVLLISTRVLHIAFFASLSIISVLVSVTGTMVLLGWNLGAIESILIGIIAGFSVDYVVHLAHAYETASGSTPERIVEAFADMGISVLNGMVTSIGASIPLFFCQLQFFGKFGVFLCLTIAFSWIFANFGFMSVLAQLKIPIKKKGCRL